MLLSYQEMATLQQDKSQMFQHEDFEQGIAPTWQIGQIGRGLVSHTPGQAALIVPPTPQTEYSDAQLADYTVEARDFRWKPPLKMTVRARAAHPASEIRGTAGFGFWNHPFAPGEAEFRLPQAVWFFFGSPPNRIELARDVPGSGWKAAVINARRWQFLSLLPFAPVGIPLMWIPPLYRLLWPVGQNALGVSETLLSPGLLASTHTYGLNWQPDSITFTVDDEVVLHTHQSPRGPLGFIAWIDNQYAIVTPRGQFGFGLIEVPQEQCLILEEITIIPQ